LNPKASRAMPQTSSTIPKTIAFPYVVKSRQFLRQILCPLQPSPLHPHCGLSGERNVIFTSRRQHNLQLLPQTRFPARISSTTDDFIRRHDFCGSFIEAIFKNKQPWNKYLK
jgi:hypothetical protein